MDGTCRQGMRAYGLGLLGALLFHATALAGAEVTLDRTYLAGVAEQLPEVPFAKAGRYRGAARRFRITGIDPAARALVVTCAVAGEYKPPVAVALQGGRAATSADGWKSFAFEVRVGIGVEAGRDGLPKFRVEVEEVKRRELEGVAGLLARVLGRSFDTIVTEVAAGKAGDLNRKLNAQLAQRLAEFQRYGVLREVGYTREGVTLRFDLTLLKCEGVAGHVYPEPRAGTLPLHRYVRAGHGDHFYLAGAEAPAVPGYTYEGVACHVPGPGAAGAVPLWGWRGRREWFYTTREDGEGAGRLGYRPAGAVCSVLAAPGEGTVPFYRFVGPTSGLHFYTTHPYAEFAK